MVQYVVRTSKGLTTEVSEFERIVRIGLGRAILALKTTDPRPFHNVILEACLHDWGFDTQVEGGRAEYVFDLINLSGEPAYFNAQVLSALKTEAECYNLSQLFELSCMFAQEGNSEARATMYMRFAANAVEESLDLDLSEVGAEEIIRLDGVNGLLYVAEKLGERALADEDYWDDGGLLRFAEGQVGVDTVRRAIERARSETKLVDAYLRVVETVEMERNQERHNRVDFTKLSYDELKQRMQDIVGEFNFRSTQWGQHANQESLERAATDLLSEADPTRVYAYLRIFWKRPFPFRPESLIAMALSEDEKLVHGALNALRNIRHPLVRELALSLLANPARAYWAVDLLEKNYESGDHSLIEGALEAARADWDENLYHGLGLGATGVFEANPTWDAAPALVTLYENGPCSKCRERCFDLLQKLNALPEWMVEECLFDANPDLREKATLLRPIL